MMSASSSSGGSRVAAWRLPRRFTYMFTSTSRFHGQLISSLPVVQKSSFMRSAEASGCPSAASTSSTFSQMAASFSFISPSEMHRCTMRIARSYCP